jgi:hypothetical protein
MTPEDTATMNRALVIAIAKRQSDAQTPESPEQLKSAREDLRKFKALLRKLQPLHSN